MQIYDEEPEQLVKWTLLDKATSTLAVRLSAVTSYLSWLDGLSDGVKPITGWPPSAESSMKYIQARASAAASPSKAASFLEALRFLHHVLGFDTKAAAESRILAGMAAEQKVRLGVRKQSPFLTAAVVKRLEHRLCDGDGSNESLMVVGAMLVLISLRA
eukprot:9407095-Karenia_brevis.AAC.1